MNNKREVYHGKTLEAWRKYSESQSADTPIQVFKYIKILEELAEERGRLLTDCAKHRTNNLKAIEAKDKEIEELNKLYSHRCNEVKDKVETIHRYLKEIEELRETYKKTKQNQLSLIDRLEQSQQELKIIKEVADKTYRLYKAYRDGYDNQPDWILLIFMKEYEKLIENKQ